MTKEGYVGAAQLVAREIALASAIKLHEGCTNCTCCRFVPIARGRHPSVGFSDAARLRL